ncbi:exonuclease domain-containing protein [Salinibacterium sp. TMP30]|uniref:exonuclease domain-containing protein n=1 Tax=Salinibacterium sp. TMP30 TaxID=3138237 RepID=UPI003139D92B
MAGPGFAVIDFETTGLFAGGHDRVIEIAVVHVDAEGTVEGRWETLVNPQRDLGPQRIHQIRASDVVDAPTFTQIAAHLIELLAGRVLVVVPTEVVDAV